MKRFLRTPWLWAALLAALVLAVVFRPVPFEDFCGAKQTESFYVTAFDGQQTREARPQREEIRPLLDALEPGTVRFYGRKSSVRYAVDSGVYVYRLFCFDQAGRDSGFLLRSDGAVFRPLYLGDRSLGYTEYRLEGCDLPAAEAQLRQLLGMEPADTE